MVGHLQTAQHFHVSNTPLTQIGGPPRFYNETFCHLICFYYKALWAGIQTDWPQWKKISTTVGNTSVGYGGPKSGLLGEEGTLQSLRRRESVGNLTPWVNHRALSHFWVFFLPSGYFLSAPKHANSHIRHISLVSTFQLMYQVSGFPSQDTWITDWLRAFPHWLSTHSN